MPAFIHSILHDGMSVRAFRGDSHEALAAPPQALDRAGEGSASLPVPEDRLVLRVAVSVGWFLVAPPHDGAFARAREHCGLSIRHHQSTAPSHYPRFGIYVEGSLPNRAVSCSHSAADEGVAGGGRVGGPRLGGGSPAPPRGTLCGAHRMSICDVGLPQNSCLVAGCWGEAR